MKKLILKRISENEHATFGVFIFEMIPICVSLELPWRDNDRNISCIPEGMYNCSFDGDRYLVHHVPHRSAVQIHSGNLPRDTRGCILPGEEFEPLSGNPAVRESKRALKEMIAKLGDKFTLKIVPPHRDEYIFL